MTHATALGANDMGTTLTIGIPTFQRRDAVLRTVCGLLAGPLPTGVDVLVIDNASTDGTFAALRDLAATDPRLRGLRNESNLGYVGNLARLFEESRSDYLLVNSDEDDVVLENLPVLMRTCADTRPAMVSPQAIIDGRIYRGQAVRRAITPPEYAAASFYISGVTFDTVASVPLCRTIKDIAPENSAAETYPQTLLAAELLMGREGLWLDTPLTKKREQLATHITGGKHGKYYHLAARWDQYVAFQAYLSAMASRSSGLAAERAQVMLQSHACSLYEVIRKAIENERPDLLAHFAAGAANATQPRVVRYLRAALRDPRRAVSETKTRILRMLVAASGRG